MSLPTEPEKNALRADLRQSYGDVGAPYPDAGSDEWLYRFGHKCGGGSAVAIAHADTLAECRRALGWTPPAPIPPPTPTPPQNGVLAPLAGYLRASGSVWCDDSGPRSPRLQSYFRALWDYRHDLPLFRRNLDEMVGFWHGARVFWNLTGDPWDGVSSPEKNTTDIQVDVRWPDFDAVFVGALREFYARGLRVSLTNGDLFRLPTPEATYARIARLCTVVNEQTVGWHAVINEPGATSPWGDGYDIDHDLCSPAPWSDYRRLLQAFRQIYPWNHHGTGCQGGDPEATENSGQPSGVIYGSLAPATMACVQGTRRPVHSAIERAFDVGYRVRPAVGVPVLAEEPSGNNGAVPAVYEPIDDHDELFALYTVMLLTGQALTALNSCGLWERAPLSSVWGFYEMPMLWAQIGIPEDIGTYKVDNLNRLPITGTGMYRCDGSYSEAKGEAFAVVHGGAEWSVLSRWRGQVQVYRSQGLLLDRHVEAGEQIFSESGASKPCIVKLTRS